MKVGQAMGKQKLKNRRGKVLLINRLGKFERINQEEMKILVNGIVPGLATIYAQWKRKTAVLTVDASQWVPLSYHLHHGMDASVIFNVLWYTVSIAYDCERHGLRIDNLCWNPNCIFVDERGSVWMVYWPVTTLEQISGGPLHFYTELYQYLAESGVEQGLIQQYGQYFYQRTQFDFHRFYALVTEIYGKWRFSIDEQKREIKQQRQEGDGVRHRPNCSYRLSGIWLENSTTKECYGLSSKQNRIGRDDSWADLVLEKSKGISRRHAVISAAGQGRFVITDMGSANGTFVEGKRIPAYKQIPLADGNRIRCGSIGFVFRQTNLEQTISIHQLGAE